MTGKPQRREKEEHRLDKRKGRETKLDDNTERRAETLKR